MTEHAAHLLADHVVTAKAGVLTSLFDEKEVMPAIAKLQAMTRLHEQRVRRTATHVAREEERPTH
ncbi:MAG TPA: hypothetical protein VH482_00605 [Thermomicrobiales bacterium]|jgi:hypothetical protein